MTTGFVPDPSPSPQQQMVPGFKPDAQPQAQQTPVPGFKPDNAPKPAQPQNQDPAGFRKWLTGGGLYGQNPGVNVMQDFSTTFTKFGAGGIRPQFKSIVQQLVNQGNSLGVYDFDKGHHYAPNDPHLDGRAMDVDTVNKEPVGTRLSPNLGQFINQALQSDPRVRLGVPKEIYNQLGSLTGNGRIFVDAPAHIHVEFDPMSAAPGKAPAVKGFTPDQPKPTWLGKPQEAGISSAIQKAAGVVEETGKGFFKEMGYEMGHPLEAYTDAEGVFQRAVTGYLSKAEPPGSPWLQTQPERILPAIGQAFYDAFHPHSVNVQHRDDAAAIKFAFQPLGISEQPNVWAHFGQAVVAQAVTDPVTYIAPFLRAAATAGTLSKVASVLDEVPALKAIFTAKQAALGKLANGAAGELVKKYLGIRPELRPLLEDHAFDARLQIEQAAVQHLNPLRHADERLLSENEGGLRNVVEGELPEPVRQRYLQEPYVYGNQEMREQAKAMGYHPTPEEAAKPPANLLNYKVRDDYQTLIKPKAGGETQDQAFERISGGDGTPNEYAPFEKPRKGEGQLGSDQYKITENRLRLGRNLIHRRMVDRDTAEYLKANGGAKPGLIDMRQLSSQPWTIQTPFGTFWRKLANEAIKGTALPHAIGNVGPFQWVRGGWTSVGLAMKHAVTGLSEEQIARQKALGIWEDYGGTDLKSPWRKPPFSYAAGKGVEWWIDHVGSPILNRLEAGFRQGLLDLADHQKGFDPKNLRNEYGKAKDVMDAVGDYRNISRVVAALSGFMGAPFAAFGLSVVPKAMWTAMKQYPERLAGYSRMIQDLRHDKGGPLPPGQEIAGGGIEKFAKEITDPIGTIESPSILGPASFPVGIEERIRHHEPVDPGELGGQLLQSYGGVVGNAISTGLGLAYHGPGQQPGLNMNNLRGALLDWMTGRYLKNEPSQRSEDYFNRTEESGSYPKKIHHRHFSQ